MGVLSSQNQRERDMLQQWMLLHWRKDPNTVFGLEEYSPNVEIY